MKRFFRFHLSTLVLMSLLAGGAIWLVTKSSEHNHYLRTQGQPLPWKIALFSSIDIGASRFEEGTAEWRFLGIRIVCVYDSETGMCYKALAIDVIIWLVVLLTAGVLIEWLTRRFSRKPTSTKP